MIPWRRKWQPTPGLLPGKSYGRRSLVGYSPWDGKELDTTERLHYTLRNKNVKAREILETTRSSTIPCNRVRGNTLGGYSDLPKVISNRYTLLHLRWLTNKNLLYSTGNSVQCYVEAWIRGSLGEKGYIYMYGCCPPKLSGHSFFFFLIMTFLIGYTPIQK